MSSYVISVDLGGTNLRVGAVDTDGQVVARERYPSESRLGSQSVLERVIQGVKKMAEVIESKGGEISGVALGFPGIVDPAKGIVYQSPHFQDWKNLDILTPLQKEIAWPLNIDNDANFAALGEGWKGAGQGIQNFVMLTLGTGVGGGIILNREIFHGDRGFAGELGHICIETSGPRCACGSRGCLEAFVSASGTLQLIETSDDPEGREQLLNRLDCSLQRLTLSKIYEAARDGDIFANRVFKRLGFYLGVGIASLMNTFGVETFIVGGGISQAWDFFIETTKREIAERTYPEMARTVQIKKSVLGDDAGLVGGAAAFKKV